MSNQSSKSHSKVLGILNVGKMRNKEEENVKKGKKEEKTWTKEILIPISDRKIKGGQ